MLSAHLRVGVLAWLVCAATGCVTGGIAGTSSGGGGTGSGTGANASTTGTATSSSATLTGASTVSGTGGGMPGVVCIGMGSFCGGHGATNGDASTLYQCPAQGVPPVAATPCSNGCQTNANGPDQCVVKPGTGGLMCAGSGLYCGGDMIGGDPSTLYDCPGAGSAPSSSQACANGCQTNPPGTNDLCKASGITCAGPGDYCGGDMMSGDPSTLYHCSGAGSAPASSTACANGCQVEPAGTNDVCKSTISCPGGGDYCGSDGVQGGASNTLYHCPGAGQAPSSSTPCSQSCTVEPAGTNDFCASTSNCPTGGDYCGNDGLNGPANVLFHCNAGGQPPASSTPCSGGCTVEPAGTNDFCTGSTGSCSALGQGALNWEANQLNTGNSWSDYCLGFVNQAYQHAGQTIGYLQQPDANAALQHAQATGQFVPWNGSCPCGGILFWSANSCNGEWGHVVICNGDGTVSTSGWPGYGGSTHATISWLDGEECGHTPAGYILP